LSRSFRRSPTIDVDDIPVISAGELKTLLDRRESVVPLDVRQPGGYAEYRGAIPSSIRIPPSAVPDRYAEIPRDRLVVPYCTCPNEATSARVAHYLRYRGFPKVRVLDGGFAAWVKARYPVEDERCEH
jgi:rhodanese-related sulfurtransferase